MNKFKSTGVLFDLDGTLVDSAADIRLALNAALHKVGRNSCRLDEVKSWIGEGARILTENALIAGGGSLGQAGGDAVMQDFLAIYASHPVVESTLFPGVHETLEILQQQDIKLAICTNKPSQTARPVIETLAIDKYFSVVLCGDQVTYRKPDGRHIHACIDMLGISADRSVMIGDSESDAYAAKDAGIPCVMVGFGYSHVPLNDLLPSAIIDNLQDLPEILAKILH